MTDSVDTGKVVYNIQYLFIIKTLSILGTKENSAWRACVLLSQSCLTLCSLLGSSVGEGNGTPLQYPCLENPMDGGAWWAAIHGVAKSQDTTERPHFHFSLSCIGEGNGNPLQCSCLENPRDGGAWWAAVYGVAQSRTRLKRLSSSSRGRALGA